ncbi:MAG: DEAD/DEAH box helicase, partial [Firmicutes bacterium]|nr:DEAD/DEAH box helicase [Bacillota bacterium]
MGRSAEAPGLFSPVTSLKGVGPKKAACFSRLGIEKISDVLELYPREYEDMRNKKTICQLRDGDKAVVTARIFMASLGRGFGKNRTLHVYAEDDTGRMEVLFFNGTYFLKQFQQGSVFRFFGKAKVENGRVMMMHPSYSKADDASEEDILPVYPLTRGLMQKDVRAVSRYALKCSGQIPETLPAAAISSANLCGIAYAYSNIHYPEGDDAFRAARYRLVYEELFYLDAALAMSRSRGGSGRKGNAMDVSGASGFVSALPYELTGAQKRALKEVLSDLASPNAMNRLVQGDVGSGKTVIAAAAMFTAAKNGFQSAFMAPTDILARQHFETLRKLYKGFDINVGLLTANIQASERKAVLKGLSDGTVDIAVGTHALISEGTSFKSLGLVITDEQHRFGVNQRELLSSKGVNPDVLVMTATPIPRTLA